MGVDLHLQRNEETNSQHELVPQSAFILSPREKQPLRRFARGKTDRKIAREIGGTERQVAAQRQTLLKKLQVQSEAQLADAAGRFASWPSKSMKAQ
jgi:DNA-binding CsgD family transcriptional regulator